MVQLTWRLASYTLFWPFLVLLFIMLFNLFFVEGFFTLEIRQGHLYGSLIDILNNGFPLVLLAMGMTFVIATRGVDLSVGAVIAISAAVAATLIGRESDSSQMPLFLVIGITLGVATICGLWNGLLVAHFGIQPMVATLILMVAGRGIAQMITKGQIPTIYYEPYYFFGSGYVLGLRFPIFIGAFVVLFALFLSWRTALGLFTEAVGISASASYHSGINEKRVKLFAYVFCGLCAGIAGIIISSNIRSADANNAGMWSELNAILAVVLGGTSMSGGRFSLVGSLLGALIIQSLTTTMYSFGVAPNVVLVVKAIVVLVVCLIQSEVMHEMIARRVGGQLKGALQ